MAPPSFTIFSGLLDPYANVVVREQDPQEAPPLTVLHPDEARLVERAVLKRQQEFASGRTLANEAMRELGLFGEPLLRKSDRAPAWPDGVVGSITHTRGYCAVAVALQKNVRAVGLDVEQAAPLKPKLLDAITCEEDRAWLSAQRGDPMRLAKAVFSVKECAYKAQYLLTEKYLGFEAMSVVIDEQRGTWRATLRQDVGDHFAVGDTIEGHIRWAGSFVATAAVLLR